MNVNGKLFVSGLVERVLNSKLELNDINITGTIVG